jgi:uncharacterized protein YoxC
MLETIPAIYWMIIIAVPVGFLTFILFEIGMFVKESRGIVIEAKETINKTNKLLDDAQEIITTAKSTVDEVRTSIITPIRSIGSVLASITGFISGLKK